MSLASPAGDRRASARDAGARSRQRRSDVGTGLPGWLVFVACVVGLLVGAAGPEASAQPPAPVAGSADAGADGAVDSPKEGQAGDQPSAPSASAAQSAPAPPPPGGYKSGLYPMPDDEAVPMPWMPPGTSASPIPSDEIFPPQTLTIRFNHKKHVRDAHMTCKTCHAGAYTSDASSDRLLPNPVDTCDACHGTDHTNLRKVEAGSDAMGQCVYCHLGQGAGEGGKVAPLILPNPNLRFTHKKHLARKIDCAQCHGQVGQIELASRDQLPRMAGCFTCHNMSGAAQGDAKGECTTCHLTRPDGRLLTSFTTGDLVPPRWLHSAGHSADWIERHKMIAANDSAFCGSCHTSNYCTDCHDGKVRPRKVHPNDWVSMHPQAARQDNPRCVSCHQEQTFCADCHRRVGVARDGPSGARQAGRRFHPPPWEWTTAPRGPKHHAWEAARNLNACVSCHSERDCATCHATKGLSGGQGVNPHPSSFAGKCGVAFQRNPRPCLVCHQSNDAVLRECR